MCIKDLVRIPERVNHFEVRSLNEKLLSFINVTSVRLGVKKSPHPKLDPNVLS